MLDTFSLPDPFENGEFCIAPIRWNQNRDGFPDNFFRFVAEETFSRVIPTLDPSLEILAYDRVVR